MTLGPDVGSGSAAVTTNVIPPVGKGDSVGDGHGGQVSTARTSATAPRASGTSIDSHVVREPDILPSRLDHSISRRRTACRNSVRTRWAKLDPTTPKHRP